jgi:hypothetical protein
LRPASWGAHKEWMTMAIALIRGHALSRCCAALPLNVCLSS